MSVSATTIMTGADTEIEEGGGGAYIHIKWGLVRRARRTQLSVHALSSFPRPSRIRRLQYVASRRLQYVAQKPENEATYIEHAQSGL